MKRSELRNKIILKDEEGKTSSRGLPSLQISLHHKSDESSHHSQCVHTSLHSLGHSHFKNSFELQFMYHMIYPFNHNSMGSGIFKVVQPPPQSILEHFNQLQKKSCTHLPVTPCFPSNLSLLGNH